MWNVTITGADDRTSPEDLLSLSKEYPFVEWGILYSNKQMGQPRYPTREWLLRFAQMPHDTEVRTSLHLCGRDARAVMEGSSPPFQAPRVQINGFSMEKARGFVATENVLTYILQCRSEQDILNAATLEAFREKLQERANVLPYQAFALLYDVSGGRGVRPYSWPKPPEGVQMGYAGGINPDNVTEVLHQLQGHPHTWIDIESGVRTDDALDIAKVQQLLERVKRHNEGTP